VAAATPSHQAPPAVARVVASQLLPSPASRMAAALMAIMMSPPPSPRTSPRMVSTLPLLVHTSINTNVSQAGTYPSTPPSATRTNFQVGQILPNGITQVPSPPGLFLLLLLLPARQRSQILGVNQLAESRLSPSRPLSGKQLASKRGKYPAGRC
jgi:hypothetical protein